MRRHGPRCAPAPPPALTRAGSLALIAFLASAAAALAADPTASPPGGDVRTNPAAPGLVGDPLFAVLGVIVIGLIAVIATLAAVRLAAHR